MKLINDPGFGEIVISQHHNTTRVSLSIATDGRLKISTPRNTSQLSIKLLIKTSRANIRKLLTNNHTRNIYDTDRQIGKSHNLIINNQLGTNGVRLVGTKIIVSVALGEDIKNVQIQQMIRQTIIKALRKEAKSYLPRRLSYLATENGFSYTSTKLTHASSRWGSCSSRGTISLNIALMQLPFELIDYVVIHELCHTVQMNHSQKFWDKVKSLDPNFKSHRLALKKFSPNI